MRHLEYIYKDTEQLQRFYAKHIKDDEKVVIQVHTGEESVVNDIYSALIAYQQDINVIPVIEKDVDTKLYMTIYPASVLVADKENFLDHDLYKAIIDSTKEGFWLLD